MADERKDVIFMMQKISTAYFELEGTHYEIGRQMARLLGKEALHIAPIDIFTGSKRFSNEKCGVEIPIYWQEYKKAGLLDKVCGEFGIRIFSEEGCKEFEYCIGCKTECINEITDLFKKVIIPSYN